MSMFRLINNPNAFFERSSSMMVSCTINAPPFGSASYAFLEKHLLFVEVPVVEDVPHDEDVGRRQRVFEEVTRCEGEPALETERLHVVCEHGADGGQVELAAGQVLVRERDLDRNGTLRAADVNERSCTLPTETSARSQSRLPC